MLDRIYGSLIGSAIGDALGGPVEGWDYQKIEAEYGRLDRLLEYDPARVNPHGPFGTAAGSYTDDTRMSILLLRAAVAGGGQLLPGHIAAAFELYRRGAGTALERSFIEEYLNKAAFGTDKEAFGGRPTNGGIMGVAPLGLLYPCDPVRAYDECFRNLFISTGSARSASALSAAMIAAAFRPGATASSVIEDALGASETYRRKVEDRYWRRGELYPVASLKAEQLLEQAAGLGFKYRDPYAFKAELYNLVVQPFFADGSETLAIAAAMFAAAGGDYEGTVLGCVNFGRDNDSSASVGGAVAGALRGAAEIRPEWIRTIETANPAPLPQQSILELGQMLSAVVSRRCVREFEAVKSVAAAGSLSASGDCGADENGKNDLHRAAAEGRLDELKALLASGADPDAVDANGTTALHFAAWENRPECVRFLLSCGADAEIAEGRGWTALYDAVRKEYVDIACIFIEFMNDADLSEERGRLQELEGDARFLGLLKLMKNEYIALDSIGICGKGLLHDAKQRGYAESMEYLEEQGVSLEA